MDRYEGLSVNNLRKYVVAMAEKWNISAGLIIYMLRRKSWATEFSHHETGSFF